MNLIFFGLAIISAIWGVVSSIMITSFLSRQGIKINWIFLRIMILKYIHQYSKITSEKTGKPGPWYYSYIFSMILALIFVIIGLFLK